MAKLACSRCGRIALHLLALLGDRAVRFHAAGIRRELRDEAIMEARSG